MTETTALATTSVFGGIQQFEDAQRICKALASSTLIPPQFQGQQGFSNCLVALEIANRMGMGIFQVMQNLNIIHGRPSWSSQFIIGLIQGCGRFKDFDFVVTGAGDAMACYCTAVNVSTGKEVKGPSMSIEMARKEGWTKNTKWATMPEIMLRYRAASAYGRLHIPDLLIGIQSQEEVIDVQEVTVRAEAPATTLSDLKCQDCPG
jgi:hypothetical protein